MLLCVIKRKSWQQNKGTTFSFPFKCLEHMCMRVCVKGRKEDKQ